MRAEGLPILKETFYPLVVIGDLRPEHFDSYGTFELRVIGKIDLAHAACA